MIVAVVMGLMNSVFRNLIQRKFNWNTRSVMWCSGEDSILGTLMLVFIALLTIWFFLLLEKIEGIQSISSFC